MPPACARQDADRLARKRGAAAVRVGASERILASGVSEDRRVRVEQEGGPPEKRRMLVAGGAAALSAASRVDRLYIFRWPTDRLRLCGADARMSEPGPVRFCSSRLPLNGAPTPRRALAPA